MRTRLTAAALLLTAVVSWSPHAAAAADAERMKTAADEFDAGRRAYKLRDFENAAVHFENADRDVPSPEALQSAIRARKEGGQDAKAATLAAWGLARYPNDKNLAEYVGPILTELDKALYKLTVNCSPECALMVDEKVAPFGETAAATLYLDPGKHSIVAGWPNERHTTADIEATAGGSNGVFLSAPPGPKGDSASDTGGAAATPTDGDAAQGSGLPPAVFFVGVGATAILAGVTLWSGIDTLNNPGKDAVAKQCLPRDTNCPVYQEGLSHQRRTNLLLAATGVVAVTTGAMGFFFTNWGGRKAAKDEAFLSPTVSVGDGITFGAVGRF
jgi:hypothetical protein